jgi:hypothetical protein
VETAFCGLHTPQPNQIILLKEVYHMIYEPVTDEGLYAELMRFHREGEGDLDDLEWKEGWNLEETLSFHRYE